MQIRKKTDEIKVLLYFLFGAAILFLRFVGDNGEPLGLALVYAISAAGLSPLIAALLFTAATLVGGTAEEIVLAAGQALLLALAFTLRDALKKSAPRPKTDAFAGFLPLFALSVALGAFVGLANFTPYVLPFTFLPALNAVTQKTIIAAAIFLLACIFTVAVKSLLRKLLRCRLKGEEIVFSLLLFVFIGVGICRFLSVNAYLGIAFFILLLFSYATKDATALFCAFALSLPPMLVAGLSPERFFVYGVAVALFIKSGRLAAVCALISVFFIYGYFDGLYAYPTAYLVQSVLTVVLPSLFFILLPTPIVREMENRLIFYREKHLSRIAINRNRAAIGEQLYEISSVFREIQATFAALGTTEAEEGAKEYIRACVVEEVCKTCPQYRACARKNILGELPKIVDVGCNKGRATLIDVPRVLADACVNQSNLLYALNRQIVEYRKYMTEAENAANGRALLAGQAQGISEILKSLALEQSEPLRIYTDKEHALNTALLSVGIVCSEVLVYGEEDNPTLSLITFGKADVKKIAAVASHLFNAPMMISQRITLSQDKFCCILRKKPYFDAAFGVSTMKKTGENASGDTHSVVKIDERRFLVALSDGMGSGEYARRISESTISLLESFYRAKMPSDCVLSTINKLLAFSKEETFACVDIGIVNLDDGKADVVKIGSPVAFILSGNTVKVLEGNSLPLGILDSLHPDTASYDLAENDVLLFLSDGITGAFGSTTDLYEVLKGVPIHNPQQLTDLLLEKALSAYGGVAKDDMTAVAVRLYCAA